MKSALRQFWDDESGVVAVELVLMVPILTWAFLSTYVYFDVFRVESNANRAALTVADMFSREEAPIDDNYLDGAHNLLRELTFEETNPDYRLTVYTYRETQDDYRVIWSKFRGYLDDLKHNDLENMRNRLPVMANGDRAILLETRVEYDAPFRIGLGPFTGTDLDDVTFTTFTVIRPRAPTLCWDMPDPQADTC